MNVFFLPLLPSFLILLILFLYLYPPFFFFFPSSSSSTSFFSPSSFFFFNNYIFLILRFSDNNPLFMASPLFFFHFSFPVFFLSHSSHAFSSPWPFHLVSFSFDVPFPRFLFSYILPAIYLLLLRLFTREIARLGSAVKDDKRK